MNEQWIVTGEDQNGEYGVWSADGKKCLVSATSRHLATITAEYANETNATELATLKAQRDELLTVMKKIKERGTYTTMACKTLDGQHIPAEKRRNWYAETASAAIANAEKDKPEC